MCRKYVVISPVRNEEEYLEGTIKSVISQTILPTEYILVNDGSTDRTPEIITAYTKEYNWIKRVDIVDRGYYLPGAGVVNAFYSGFNQITKVDWDFVVKLDCDLTFENNYFELLLKEFENYPKLGLASGCTYINLKGKLIQEKTLPDHPWGASKVYRKECWEQIGGINAIPGWDLADLLAAQMHGWETRCFYNLRIIHHRNTGGRREGFSNGKFLHGKNLYRFGYSFYYILLKGIYRIFEKPFIIGGLSIICGYVFAFINREPALFSKEMRYYLRKRQRNYIITKLVISKKLFET